MQYDVSTPEEYLEVLQDDWRKEKLLILREMIRVKAPDLTEGIQYKMLSYGDGTTTVFALNAQKNYVALYVGDIAKIDESGEMLKGLNLGKGCIRLSKSITIADTGLEPFIDRTIALWRQGIDIDC